MATNAPQDDWHKTGLRLPKELHQQLHEAAAASGRSYNSEIVSRLQESFARTSRLASPAPDHTQEVMETPATYDAATISSILATQTAQLRKILEFVEEAGRGSDEVDIAIQSKQKPKAPAKRGSRKSIAEEMDPKTFDRVLKANTSK